MKNKFTCNNCCGSGDNALHDRNPADIINNVCPSCEGSGYLMLAVEEWCKFCNQGTHDRGEWFDTCPVCNGNYKRYRPLSEQELEELIDSVRPRGTTQYDPVELILDNAKRGTQTFNGKPVKLVP